MKITLYKKIKTLLIQKIKIMKKVVSTLALAALLIGGTVNAQQKPEAKKEAKTEKKAEKKEAKAEKKAEKKEAKKAEVKK